MCVRARAFSFKDLSHTHSRLKNYRYVSPAGHWPLQEKERYPQRSNAAMRGDAPRPHARDKPATRARTWPRRPRVTRHTRHATAHTYTKRNEEVVPRAESGESERERWRAAFEGRGARTTHRHTSGERSSTRRMPRASSRSCLFALAGRDSRAPVALDGCEVGVVGNILGRELLLPLGQPHGLLGLQVVQRARLRIASCLLLLRHYLLGHFGPHGVPPVDQSILSRGTRRAPRRRIGFALRPSRGKRPLNSLSRGPVLSDARRSFGVGLGAAARSKAEQEERRCADDERGRSVKTLPRRCATTRLEAAARSSTCGCEVSASLGLLLWLRTRLLSPRCLLAAQRGRWQRDEKRKARGRSRAGACGPASGNALYRGSASCTRLDLGAAHESRAGWGEAPVRARTVRLLTFEPDLSTARRLVFRPPAPPRPPSRSSSWSLRSTATEGHAPRVCPLERHGLARAGMPAPPGIAVNAHTLNMPLPSHRALPAPGMSVAAAPS